MDSLAWMNGCHVGPWKMWMRFHCDCFLGMILTHVFVHLFDVEGLAVFIVANYPQTRCLIVFVICYVQIISSRVNHLIA